MMNEIQTLLKRKDYIPVVQRTDNGCIVIYPHAKLNRVGSNRIVERYIINHNEVDKPGFLFATTLTNTEEFVQTPPYCIRICIEAEINRICGQLGVSTKLVEYQDENGTTLSNLHDVVPPPTLEEDLHKEGFLNKLFVEAQIDHFPIEFEKVAATHQVDEGYNLLVKLFKD